MPFQTGKNIVIGYKVEATFNTAPGTGSARQLRLNSSAGLDLKRALIRPNEVRQDGLPPMARLGSRMADGTYGVDNSVGELDTAYEALMRSIWVATVAITQAAMTSITTTTSTIVAAAGSWITQGVRVGDVVRLTGHATVANNNINLRVKAVTASTITVFGTPLTADAVADTSFTLTISKKLKNGATPTERTFYFDQYNGNIDESQVFGGVKFIGFKLTGTPNGMAITEVSLLGASMAVLASGSSPYFVSPTLGTALGLTFADAAIAYNGSDLATVTAFEMNYVITAKAEEVIGSSTTPDIFANDATLTGTLTVIRQDLGNLTKYLAETEVELNVLLTEPESEPKDFIAFHVPRVKLTGVVAPLGGDGAMTETLSFIAGKKESTTGYDDTLLTISTSAA